MINKLESKQLFELMWWESIANYVWIVFNVTCLLVTF